MNNLNPIDHFQEISLEAMLFSFVFQFRLTPPPPDPTPPPPPLLFLNPIRTTSPVSLV